MNTKSITSKKPKIDIHTKNASVVAKHQYLVVGEVSMNEVAGLLVGTEVKKISDPEARPSKYWNGNYYTVMVECPNGETRRLGCDALLPRKTNKYFERQRRHYAGKKV